MAHHFEGNPNVIAHSKSGMKLARYIYIQKQAWEGTLLYENEGNPK